MAQTTQVSEEFPTDSLEKYLPFIIEIRKRLLFLFSVFLIFSILGFIFYEKIITFVLRFFNLEGVNVVLTSPFQFLNLAVTSGLLMGTVVIFPLVAFQILSFLRPALHPKEYRTIISLSPLSFLLFIAGFGFGIAIMRYVVALFYQKSLSLEIGNFLDISLLLSQILVTAVLMGLAFQFPIILTILMRLKVVKYQSLVNKRLFAYAISVVFATLLPPTDLLSLVFLTLPLVLLFELTLILNRYFLKSHIL